MEPLLAGSSTDVPHLPESIILMETFLSILFCPSQNSAFGSRIINKHANNENLHNFIRQLKVPL